MTKIIGYSFSVLLLVISIWTLINKQDVIDWYRLRNYEPSPSIARLATDSSFSDEGRRLFYVHDPELLNKENFFGKCTSTEETIILGCYLTHYKIFVLDVEDERLEGVEEVTAAHEMLHAVYDRLNEEEKNRLETLLMDVFTELNDERINETIESYRLRDPSVVTNELHSIIATEVLDLPDELEQHYSRYFLDRKAIVKVAQAYEAEFTKLEERAEQLLEEFQKLKQQTDEYDSQLLQQNINLQQERTNLEQLGVSLETEKGQLDSLENDPQAYNSALPAYNALVGQYNAQLAKVRNLIEAYNLRVSDRNAVVDRQEEIINEINKISVQEKELLSAIDTRLPEAE